MPATANPTGFLSRLTSPIRRYARWLHTGMPAGTVERLPQVDSDGRTNVPGVYVVGDLTGIPLLKFSADTGARAVRTILGEPGFHPGEGGADVVDVAIVGGGVSGVAAAIEAKRNGLSYAVYEAARPFSTIVDFPKAKPIYTYPRDMEPAGDMHFRAEVKEDLVDELEAQRSEHGIEITESRIERVERSGGALLLHHADGSTTVAKRVIIAIGRSGNFRTLGVPGEDRDNVYNRLHDPADFAGQRALVVGGGDSAIETAVALAEAGATVTLSYRGAEFSRPKPENAERVAASADGGDIDLRLGTQVREIRDGEVVLANADGGEDTLGNDVVFSMIGREPPLDFFRRSGIAIRGEWTGRRLAAFAGFVLFCVALYNWKSWGWLTEVSLQRGWWPFSVPATLGSISGTLGAWARDPSTLLGMLARSAADPGFYYTVAYSLIVVVFGIRRIRRRRTPYVKVQTLSLMAIQVVPLFLLPYVLLPWMGANGVFDSGAGKWIGDALFPGGSYWRAFGLILAWPLFVYNIFTSEPIAAWLILGFVQTFVIIPLIVYRWGKGAYCGWICSCGALAETLGDRHRYKMPHGPKYNRLNMAGQVILGIAFALLGVRIAGWIWPESWAASVFDMLLNGHGLPALLSAINWKWTVDVLLAGVIGYGAYFWYSGRVWCRFFCPLAALMHIYARLGQFRIFADKKKCISCNVCTSACHQGIDVMSFANKGLPMNDPECVRCSACVQECPTGVLTFGRIGRRDGKELPIYDSLAASPVRMRE